MIGATLGGRYEILRQLGEGGMGVVYEARQIDTGRRAALKVITGELAGNARIVERFEVEARAASAVDSEHIVEVLESGFDAEQRVPFLAMELLRGTDLHGVLEHAGALPADLALRIGAQACLGLEKAHARGIIHRDIKPGNLFLADGPGDEVRVKILDFGIAKIKMEDPDKAQRPQLTRTGAMMGSPLYMSPEQARSPRSIDHRSDIWSLGVVLYEALSGRAPLADFTDIGEIILSLCVEPPVPLAARAPWVDAASAEIVERALRINPGERYPSARAMYEAIVAHLPGGVGLRKPMLARPPRQAAPAPESKDDLGTANTLSAQPARTHDAAPLHRVPAAAGVNATLLAAPLPTTQPTPIAPALVDGPRRNAAPTLVIVAVVAALAGLGVTYARGWLGPRKAAHAALVRRPPPPETQLTASPSPPLPEALATLQGRWKSDAGRVYDAVANGEALELRIRDPGALAERGYLEHEVRFTLRAIPGETSSFAVEDSIRPVPPKGTTYDLERARATCVQSWSAIGNKPLQAERRGDRLVVKMVTVDVPTSVFQREGARIVGCSAFGRARASEVESTLTKL